MMNNVADWMVQNRDKIEKGVEIMGQASEVLAATVGQLHPVLEAVFVASSEIFSNPDGKEARFLTQQLEQVNTKLEGIQNEIDQIALEMQKTSMNKQNFDREAQMLSQYEKFQDFVNAKPKFKEKKMQKFVSHFESTDGDLNLDALYNAVTGENTAGDPMLETVVTIQRRNRRAVEDFCARLKKLFVVGIIAVMGHAALTEKTVGEETVQKWHQRMEDVETRMKAAVEDCTQNFAVQAKQDLELYVQEKPGPADMDFTKALLDSLVRKFDWVCWSIRVFNNRERIFFFNWLAGKKCHGSGGDNWFDLLTQANVKVVVSFSVEPRPIDKAQIAEQIERLKGKGNMMQLALSLRRDFPSCLVHAVSHYKEVVETNSFQPECYYYGKHKKSYVCVHPE
uniref:Rapunzel 5 n=1 Tax=Neogobius melanostomus TaxID=47308 RepID=A0A8C6SD20_9GOBI